MGDSTGDTTSVIVNQSTHTNKMGNLTIQGTTTATDAP